MFDYVVCEKELPLPEEIKNTFPLINWKETVFQTKDFDSCMNYYKIDKDGKLWGELIDGKWVDDDNAFLGGRFDIISREWVIKEHHGLINFYESFAEGDFNYWIEFQAKFTDGIVVDIKLSEYKKSSNIEQRRLLDEAFSKIEKPSWIKRKIYSFRLKVRNILYWLANKV